MRSHYSHKFTRKTVLATFLSVFFSMSMIMMIPVYAQEEGTLYLEPETVSLEGLAVNDTFTVETRITDVTDAYSIAFSVEWNTSILEMDGLPVMGDFFSGTFGVDLMFLPGTLNSTEGYLKECAFTKLGDKPGETVSSPDNELVATMTFKALQIPEAGSPINTYIEIVASASWSDNPTYWKDSPASGSNVYDFAEMNPCHVIPEFSALMYLMLFMVAALLAVIMAKKKWSTPELS